MPPHVVMRLIRLVENRLIRERSTAIPTHLSVLITLRFLAEGGLQKGFAQDFVHPVSQSTASQCIARVIDTINHLADDFIRFPGTEGQREHNSNRFQRTTRIPGIIGAVDGFMVTFYRPTINEEAFFNYRVGTSMNVQIIVDSDYNILNIRVCPGSNNDRFVWQFSEAKEYMEDLRADENFPNRYYIIGDSGYTPSRVLLTPDLNAAEGSPAHVYTLEHVRTRCIVERTIGILTNVWLVIDRSRKLHYSPEAVVNIIHACAVLHNFRRRQGILDENDHNFQPAELRDDVNRRGRGEAAEYAAGIAERNHIITQHFM
ncbi:putative nuclease HARBI1 isoform X1 [Nasonia vitripennis]|uniref:DDE Tnp4 domain-containing protein n=1 Tax=Nasonia vitripennis TaxID=7425 RepID=A0A7M7T7E5_NASVI|nr:putative nuclease HARBI1 isoform X1 [Nasonia vitripennis]